MKLYSFLTFFNIIQNVFAGTMCPLQQPSCEGYTYLCPKLTEITNCNEDGIEGYTTFRLSVITKPNMNIQNLYALYGDVDGEPLHLPPAYQSSFNYGSNLGGVNPFIMNTYPDTKYDSWLTIGLSEGDNNNDLSSIGVNFENWSEQNSLDITNGAVFLMDPEEKIIYGDEYLLAQITVRKNSNPIVVLNVQGKTTLNDGPPSERSWTERNIRYNLISPQIDNTRIPHGCIIWYDGCNSCMVNNNRDIDICTEMECSTYDTPSCLRYQQNGHRLN